MTCYKTFTFEGKTVTQNGGVEIDSRCNSLNFVNKGTTVVEVNGIVLNPATVPGQTGESYTVGGNADEIIRSKVVVNFVGGTGNLLMVQKIYTGGN